MSIQLVGQVLSSRDKKLTGTRKLVLVTLANYANERCECWPSQKVLAGDCGISVRALSDHLKGLEADGFVSRETQHLGAGRGSTTVYRIEARSLENAPEESARAENAHAKSVDCTGSTPRLKNRQEPSDSPSLRSGEDAPSKSDPPEKPKAKARGPARGKRLPPNWSPDAKGYATATKEGLSPEEINREADKFRDHWTAKPGQKGVMLDWDATWRNWVRRAAEYKRERASASGSRRPASSGKSGSGSLASVGLRLVAEGRGYRE